VETTTMAKVIVIDVIVMIGIADKIAVNVAIMGGATLEATTVDPAILDGAITILDAGIIIVDLTIIMQDGAIPTMDGAITTITMSIVTLALVAILRVKISVLDAATTTTITTITTTTISGQVTRDITQDIEIHKLLMDARRLTLKMLQKLLP
jgi:hypothetical protein